MSVTTTANKRIRLEQSSNEWLSLTAVRTPLNPAHPGVTMHSADLARLRMTPFLPNWVRVQDLVFKVIVDNNFPLGQIGLSAYDLNELDIGRATQVAVMQHHAGHQGKPFLNEIEFNVSYFPLDKSDKTLFAINSIYLIAHAHTFLRHQFFTENQMVTFPTAEGRFEFRVKAHEYKDGRYFSNVIRDRTFGYVNERTAIKLQSVVSNLKIIQGSTVCEDAHFRFSIRECGVSPGSADPDPYLFSEEVMKLILQGYFAQSFLFSGQSLTIPYLPLGSLTVVVDSITSYTRDDLDDFAVQLQDDSDITVTSTLRKTRVVSGSAKIPEAIKVSIKDSQIFENRAYRKPLWIAVPELTLALKGLPQGFIRNQDLKLPITGGTASVTIGNILKDDAPQYGAQHWMVGDLTDVEFLCDPSLKVPLVDTKDAHPMTQIEFKIIAPEWVRNVNIDQAAIFKALEDYNATVFAPKQTFKISIPGKPYPLRVSVDSVVFDPRKINMGEVRYGLLGEKTVDTRVVVNSGSSNLSVVKRSVANLMKNPSAYLAELGLGGISKECIDYLKSIIISNGVARNELSLLKVKPPKGIILYGPPGTGKTSLGKQIAELLGIPASRVTLVNAPSLLDKWLGGSEKLVRALFENAKKGSPDAIELIVIDEIDAIAAKRGTHQHHDPIVDAFLGELDGLSSTSNVLVIGMTNRLELIDEAVKRPGRLYPHISMGIPDLAGRKQIFEIHLKQLKENGMVAEDVSIDKLAEITPEYSGADIEGLVQQVVGECIPKGYSIGEDGKEKFSSESIKLTMKVFTSAIEKNKKTKEGNAPPPGMYN